MADLLEQGAQDLQTEGRQSCGNEGIALTPGSVRIKLNCWTPAGVRELGEVVLEKHHIGVRRG